MEAPAKDGESKEGQARDKKLPIGRQPAKDAKPVAQALQCTVDKTPFAIGRTAADLATGSGDMRVSRQHCTIDKGSDGCFVTDESSLGTWLNGQQLEKGKPAAIKDGDVLHLGAKDGTSVTVKIPG